MQYDIILEYPWKQSQLMRNLQEWMFLPDPVYPPTAKKLVCEYTYFRRKFWCSLESRMCITPHKNDWQYKHFNECKHDTLIY